MHAAITDIGVAMSTLNPSIADAMAHAASIPTLVRSANRTPPRQRILVH